MAAINFGLELREGDDLDKDRNLPREERDFLACAGPVAQLYGIGASKRCPTPRRVLNRTHANLVRMATARQTILEGLQGLRMRVEEKPKRGGKSSKFYIVYEQPLQPDLGLPWGLLPPSAANRVGLLTWTSKMETPSFSLPAGAPDAGGACPAAAGAQSVVPEASRDAVGKRALHVLQNFQPQVGGTALGEGVNLPQAVCQHCYATTGNYTMYSSMLAQQLITFAWTQAALADGTFVPTMIRAINLADYSLRHEPSQTRHTGWRFFRIHDSGDFFSREYFIAWKTIADAFVSNNPYGYRPIMFWAPTRMWVMPGWIEFVDEINGGPSNRGNFIIRPSAYELNQHAPALFHPEGGWAAGSTVFAPSEADAIARCELPPTYDWDCRAYASSNGPSCRGAENPQGQTGCRACWIAPQATVNYRAH